MLQYAFGQFLWGAGDVVGQTFTVSGLPFQPKALRILHITDFFISDPSATEASFGRRSMGFATGTASRRCVAASDQDGAGSMTCFSGFREDCVAMTLIDGTGAALDRRLDLDAILSDGFRLIVDATNGAVNSRVLWEAWGGDDITVAQDLSIAEPAATGNQDYAVAGFDSVGEDQVVMFAGVQQTGAAPSAGRQDSGFCVGFAAGTAAADNVTVVGNNDDGSASADTDGYCKTGECLAMITVAGGNPNARAQLTQWNTDGFRLNWIARGVTNRRYIALAIKGGRWKAGSYTIDGNTLNATATVSGLSFQPIGVSFIGRMSVEQAAGTADVQDRIGIGRGTSPSSRQAFGYLSENGTANSEVDQTLTIALACLMYPSAVGAILSRYDINAINSDGFQVIVDLAGGVATEWQGYLAFGTAIVPVTLNRDDQVPVEWKTAVSRPEGLSVEWLAKLLREDRIPAEWLAAIARQEGLSVEWLAALARHELLLAEWLGAVLRDEKIPAEWQGGAAPTTIERDEGFPVSWLATLSRDERIPAEWLAALLRTDTAPAEWLGALAREESAPAEWLARLLRDERVPIEWLSGVVTLLRNEGFAVEWRARLAREEAVPVDWVAAAVVAVSRDEGLPVEFQASPLVLLFLNWLAGGAGARYPERAFRERGLGEVWWTGWSRSTWVPARFAPVAPGRVVRREAKPASRRRLAHREVSRAVGVWGGRSRAAFSESPWPAIRAQEDELLPEMWRLLRG